MLGLRRDKFLRFWLMAPEEGGGDEGGEGRERVEARHDSSTPRSYPVDQKK